MQLFLFTSDDIISCVVCTSIIVANNKDGGIKNYNNFNQVQLHTMNIFAFGKRFVASLRIPILLLSSDYKQQDL